MVFRVMREGDVLALMPSIPGTYEPHTCQSYARLGQHGPADYDLCIAASRPAEPEEFASLKRELESLGYVVAPVRCASPKMREARYQALKA